MRTDDKKEPVKDFEIISGEMFAREQRCHFGFTSRAGICQSIPFKKTVHNILNIKCMKYYFKKSHMGS